MCVSSWEHVPLVTVTEAATMAGVYTSVCLWADFVRKGKTESLNFTGRDLVGCGPILD